MADNITWVPEGSYTDEDNVVYTLSDDVLTDYNFLYGSYTVKIYNETAQISSYNGDFVDGDADSLIVPLSADCKTNYKITIYIYLRLQNKTTGAGATIKRTDTFYNGNYITTPILDEFTDIYININQPINVVWSISSGTQTHFEIEVETDGVWGTIATGDTAETTYTIPADTLSNGNHKIRVKANGADGIVKTSNEVSFIGKGQPSKPIITSISNASRPLIKWSAVSQVAYNIDIYKNDTVIISTGFTYGDDYSYQVTDYLENGDYTAKLSIKNSDGLASDEAVQDFTVSFTPPTKPTVTAESVENGVKFTVDNLSDKMQLIVDNEVIKEFEDSIVYDYTSAGETSYIVRAIDENDNFADSDVITATTTIKGATLALVDNAHDYVLLNFSADNDATKSGQVEYVYSELQFAGRNYPSYEFGTSKGKTLQLKYELYSDDDFNKFKSIVDENKTLIYRDAKGTKLYGVITAYNYTYTYTPNKYTIDCDLLQTDYKAVI